MIVRPGSRALGLAASDAEERSYLCGAVVRSDRVFDGAVFTECTVGGLDVTDALVDAIERLDRPDVRWILVAGIAPAWFNLIDPRAVAEAADRPVLVVSFEESDGLEAAIDREFDGDDRRVRLDMYEELPAREPIEVGDGRLFVRRVGIDRKDAAAVLRGFTPGGGRPEPVRVARSCARSYREAVERLPETGSLRE